MDLGKDYVVFTLIILFCFTENTESHIHPDVIRLYKDLTQEYQKELFPIWHKSKTLNLNFQMYPFVINSFSETEETISLTMAVQLFWLDPQLVWNPALYGNTTIITITTDNIWIPYVYLSNSVDSLRPLDGNSEFYAVVEHDGTVYWSPGGVLQAKCPTNILRFPFDKQTCRFNFTMWGVGNEEVEYVSASEKGILSYYTPNSDWKIISQRQHVLNAEGISEFDFEITIERHPSYYIIIVILPTLMFSLMNPFVFMLPVESGERVSLGMTILLSYAIFLILVTSSVPVSSNPVCALLLTMVGIMMLSGLIVICVIISIYYYYTDEIDGINYYLRRLALHYRNFRRPDKRNGKMHISGKDVSRGLDTLFLILSYLVLTAALSGYFIFVFAT